MMKQLLTVVALTTIGACAARAQNFQKMYGYSGGADQQVLYGSFLDENNDLYTAGTFRNYATLTEVAFYGTVSKLDENGTLLWHKAYMPSGFAPMDGHLINSIFEDETHAIYTFGYYLAQTENAGYYLQKINADGGVIWSRFIANEDPDFFCKALYHDGSVYIAMADRIAKFDSDGGLVSAIAIEGLMARSMLLTTNGDLVVTGEMFYNNEFSLPLLKFNGELDLIQGSLYSGGNGTLYGTTLCEASTSSLIVGGSEGVVLKVNAAGGIDWARLIAIREENDELLSVVSHVGIQPTGLDESTFCVMTKGFEASDADFQHSAIFYTLGTDGDISDFRLIGETPYGDFGSLQPESFHVDIASNTFYMFGDLWVEPGGPEENHLNYVHRGWIDQPGCGEEPVSFDLEDILPDLEMMPYPSSLVTDITITTMPATMNVHNLSPDLDDMFCDETLGIVEPAASLIQIFPNPSGDHIRIETGDFPTGPGLITDASGRIVMRLKANTDVIDISDLASGVYVLQLPAKCGAISARFVKE